MEEYLLIAIGGSGARVAQSVVALAAAGFPALLSTKEARLTVRVVDLDKDHEEGKELKRMIDSYTKAFGFIWKDKVKRDKWQPLQIDYEQDAQFFFETGLDSNKGSKKHIEDFVPGIDNHTEADLLLNALYSDRDRNNMDLLTGCHARPRIGSLLWEYLYEQNKIRFWSSLCTLMGGTDFGRVMFVGSLFGGTGASGVPTLARLFREHLKEMNCEKYAIGMTVMAPYFYLEDEDKDWSAAELEFKVEFQRQKFQSKMALNYYMQPDVLADIDYVQVVGGSDQEMYEVDDNGNKKRVKNHGDSTETPQNDPAMPAELAAAVGIFRFFTGSNQFKVEVPKGGNDSEWGIFPDSEQVRTSLGQLERLCLVVRDYYNPIASQHNQAHFSTVMKDLWTDSDRANTDTWRSLWNGNGQKGLKHILDFSKEFFQWFNEINANGVSVLKTQEYAKKLCDKAAKGATNGIDLMGVKFSKITGIMNEKASGYYSKRKTKEQAEPSAEAFTLALLDACQEKRPANIAANRVSN